jgi:hypothetical protein
MSPTRFASQHKWLYLCAIALLLALVVVGLVRYSSVHATNKAQDKANQLADDLAEAGYRRPDPDVLARTLGTDGGLACEDPAGALRTALWKIDMANGATGPGSRPVIADTKAVAAEGLVLKVYCPDKLDDFKEKIEDLRTSHTVRR